MCHKRSDKSASAAGRTKGARRTRRRLARCVIQLGREAPLALEGASFVRSPQPTVYSVQSRAALTCGGRLAGWRVAILRTMAGSQCRTVAGGLLGCSAARPLDCSATKAAANYRPPSVSAAAHCVSRPPRRGQRGRRKAQWPPRAPMQINNNGRRCSSSRSRRSRRSRSRRRDDVIARQ